VLKYKLSVILNFLRETNFIFTDLVIRYYENVD